MKLTVNEVLGLFGRRAVKEDAEITAVVTDSRLDVKGAVFFAIKGEKNDGHDYALDVLKRGALLCICERKISGSGIVMVKSTQAALLRLAGYYASKFPKVKCAAVTGSNGKTTTKEMLSCMLAEKYSVLKSEKSFNNHIGVPHTAFRLDGSVQAAVFEIGMNHSGEIKNLVSALKLDAAVITNTGRAHIGNLGSEKAIALAKAEVFCGLKKGGLAIVNAAGSFNKLLEAEAKKAGAEFRTFGTGKADMKISSYKDKKGSAEFTLEYEGRKQRMVSPLQGMHNAENAAGAALCAAGFGLTLLQCAKGLKKFSMQGFMRFERKVIGKKTVINDCYNANPDSFAASLRTLKAMKLKKLLIVTGDMLELGKLSQQAHVALGKQLSAIKGAEILSFGKYAKYVKKGFGKKPGLTATDDRNMLFSAFEKAAADSSCIFLKGSRGNKLEELLPLIK